MIKSLRIKLVYDSSLHPTQCHALYKRSTNVYGVTTIRHMALFKAITWASLSQLQRLCDCYSLCPWYSSWLLMSWFLFTLQMKLVHHRVFLIPTWKQCLLPESLIIVLPVKAPTQYLSLSEMISVISFFSFPSLNGLHRWIFLSHPRLYLSYLE